jgi:hypothetical protein
MSCVWKTNKLHDKALSVAWCRRVLWTKRGKKIAENFMNSYVKLLCWEGSWGLQAHKKSNHTQNGNFYSFSHFSHAQVFLFIDFLFSFIQWGKWILHV